jgi:Restriction endonuclease S subunits
MLPVGSLLLSSRAPIGLLAINKIPVCTNQGFKSLIPGKDVNVEYLYYVLKANVSSLQAKGNGVTFKELAKPAVENFEVPLPPLDDQIRIAHLLGKVEGLIAQRKQHLQQLDDLLKSVFLEMFGDPVRNEKGWERRALSDITEQVVDCPHTTPRWTNEGVVCLRTSNLGVGFWIWTDTRFVDEAQYRSRTTRSELIEGDIVLSREGTVGIAAMVKKGMKVCMGQRLVQVRSNPLLTIPQYILRLLLIELAPKRISSVMAGSTSQHLNLKDLRSLGCILPPLALQNQFSAIADKVEALKSRYQQSLTDLEALYGVLSQQAFKGELDLSRIQQVVQQPAGGL